MSKIKEPTEKNLTIKMRFEKPFAFDSLLKKEQLITNEELREKSLQPMDQSQLIIKLCEEAIESRNKKREKKK